MNRFYIIVPLVLLVAFGGVYWQHSQDTESFAKGKADIVVQAKAAEQAKKTEVERHAREDADKRAAAHLAEDLKKEADQRAKWEADSVRIADDIARYHLQIGEAVKQAAVLEKQIVALRASKKVLNEEAFNAAHDVEYLLIQKRSVELEVQRMTTMVAHKAGEILSPTTIP